MELRNWIFTRTDRRLAETLQDNLPDRILDVHAHLYRLSDLGKQSAPYIDGPAEAGAALWRETMEQFVGRDKELSAYHVAPPCETAEQIEACNAYVFREAASHPESRALALIAPETGRDRVEQYLENSAVVGLKPFSYYADYDGPKGDAPLATFLPEWAWECAHDHGLMMLVHLMRRDSLSDPLNYEEIRKKALRYPNARLMLDHCGRGFNARTIIEGVNYVRDLKNVYFDTSSICEIPPMAAVLKGAGLDRVVFGSDFPLTQMRGRSITAGDGFIWLTNENVDWKSYKGLCAPVLLGIENLRALLQTAELLGMNRSDMENLFYHNAVAMTSGRK